MSKTSFYGKCPIYSSLTLPLPDLSQPSALLCVYSFIQGMVDGSASQPVLRQDTGYSFSLLEPRAHVRMHVRTGKTSYKEDDIHQFHCIIPFASLYIPVSQCVLN